MRTKPIQGVPVAAVGTGCGTVGGGMVADRTRDADSLAALARALDLGMTFVDTAEAYGEGHSEELVGQAIAGRRDDVYLASKVSPEHLRYADVLAAADRSLKRLKTDRLDLYYVHWSNPAIPLAETMAAMADLVRAGKVRHVGVSNFSIAEIEQARAALGAVPLAALQAEYNLFDRTAERTLIPYCRAHGIAFVAYSPLDQGHICGGPRRRAALEPLAARHGVAVGTLALAWLVGTDGVFAIPKAGRAAHLAANAAAGDLVLDAADRAEIDRISGAGMVDVPVERIRVVAADEVGRKVYRTAEEARANPHGFTPSPLELAEAIRGGEFLKSVRVKPSAPASGYDYDLIEGRMRYWAWVLAFDGRRDIPVLVRE